VIHCSCQFNTHVSMKKLILVLPALFCVLSAFSQNRLSLKAGFLNPPNDARPGVYWYFMDGNISRSGITGDLEAMKAAGINNVTFLEVNVGVPRGKIDFLSPEWQELFKHAEKECERLHIKMTLGTGPGWAGSGGPWVKPEESMQILVSSSVDVSGDDNVVIKLPVPENKKPYFGESAITGNLKDEWKNFYEDVAVLAFPKPAHLTTLKDADDKALFYRAPYSSVKGTKAFIPTQVIYPTAEPGEVISKNSIINLTDKLQPDGTLNWKAPKGNWTIMRFGRRNNGAVTRPAPVPGLGFEADKFDTTAMADHLANYTGKLLKKIGHRNPKEFGGLKMLHIDSWEMGSQNWTGKFRQEFTKRRGYDPLPFYPIYVGDVVESPEISERFLWDLRQTSQELILENHAKFTKTYSHKNGMGLSIEPYDMNPTADLELGNIADEPMAEFWSTGFSGYNTSFSVIEAASIAHINGIAAVPAESFTAGNKEDWKQYPGSMKNQGDWAFASGINRFVFHTFAHQPLDKSLKPGMQMGGYGVHWDRNQTWWPMVNGYHDYISRSSFMLQQGKSVADVLYLTPEGAPQVFRAPPSALKGLDTIPDRKGYNFDGCSPGQLYKATVKNHKIIFPGGASYRLLVLPLVKTMTLKLLLKVKSLVADGAIVIGLPPVKSLGLAGYPAIDDKVRNTAITLWGDSTQREHSFGHGKIIRAKANYAIAENDLYPGYEETSAILKRMNIAEDFTSLANLRYAHRTAADYDIYFVSNPENANVKTDCVFRTAKGTPELWDAVTGKTRSLPKFSVSNGLTKIPLQFYPYESYFIVFKKGQATSTQKSNFPEIKDAATLTGPWVVSFDPKWGGPSNTTFDQLQDCALNADDGIKHYSGIATYKKQFDAPLVTRNERMFIDLGEVKNMARIKLNGKSLGVVWTAPWHVDITNAVKAKGNILEIEAANLWANRLIGDEQLPDDGIKNNQFPDWLLQGKPRPAGRFSFSTFKPYKKNSPLSKSGLLGPVTIQTEEY